MPLQAQHAQVQRRNQMHQNILHNKRQLTCTSNVTQEEWNETLTRLLAALIKGNVSNRRSTVYHASNIHGDNLDPIIAIDVWATDKANLCHTMVSTKSFICRATNIVLESHLPSLNRPCSGPKRKLYAPKDHRTITSQKESVTSKDRLQSITGH